MSEWLESIPYLVASASVVIAEGAQALGNKVFHRSKVDPSIILYALTGLMLMILLVVLGAYRYKRWSKFKKIELEKKSLDLEPNRNAPHTNARGVDDRGKSND